MDDKHQKCLKQAWMRYLQGWSFKETFRFEWGRAGR